MVCQIIRREIMDNLLSLRFVLSFLLVVLLFTVSGFVFVHKHKQQLHDYWNDVNKNSSAFSEQSGKLYKIAHYSQSVYRKPKTLAVCVEGFEKSLPNHFKFNIFSVDFPTFRGRTNFLLSRFCDLDWAFIICLFLSFVALIFAYNTISGERESGTLRLMLAGAIPRHKILLGKYFGVMITLGIPLLVGILINLIIVTSSENIILNTSEWSKIFMIVLLSFIYLSFFVLLGIFVSSRSAHSANSMVMLLLIWVGLVILIPSFGRIAANTFQKVPTQAKIQRKVNELIEQLFEDALSGKYGNNAGSSGPNLESGNYNPPARARLFTALTDSKNQLIDEHVNRMVAQAAIGRRFTKISPATIYQHGCETIVGTGINRFSRLCYQVRNYQADLKDYVRSKDAEDTESLHLLFEEETTANWWKTISHKPIDFETVPKFQEKDLAFGESLQLAIWDIGLLVLFNLVFFAAAFVSFLRYDVR